MVQNVLPFDTDPSKSQLTPALRKQFSPALARACQESDYLEDYLRSIPLGEIGVPDYFDDPPRNLGDLDAPNVIYPTKEGLFTHIVPDHSGARHHFICVEPTIVTDISEVLPKVEERLVAYAEHIGQIPDPEEKKRLLLKLIDRLCTTIAPAPGKRSARILLSEQELLALRYQILREKIGLGALQPLLLDDFIEDISCSGVGPIFIEHKIFRSVQSSIFFRTTDEVDRFAVWLGEWIKHPVTVRNPLVDATLPDGSRINIVYGSEISKRGSNFTIRKFGGKPLSILELIQFGTLNYMMASYLSFMLEEGLNMFVVGATASGKTTLLNALNTFLKPDAKIVTIEDTPEVQVPQQNWIQETTRHGSGDSKGSEVGMFELLKAALRQRPDMIIVGEIRSMEAVVAFQAMQTGHGVMSTFHAGTVEKLIQRLTGDPINIPKTYIDNLHLAVIPSAVRLANGKRARRILSINEIVGYDPVSNSFSFIEAFRWNPETDVFEFPAYLNSYLLEQVIAIKRGIPPRRSREIYDEVKRRARIFEKLHKERGVTDFYEFFNVLSEARKQNLF